MTDNAVERLSNRQMNMVEIALRELGKRGNAIASSLAEHLVDGAGTHEQRRHGFRVAYLMLFQLAMDFRLVTQNSQPTARVLSGAQVGALETTTRRFAENGNAIARGLVMALNKSPQEKRAVLVAAHAQIFQALTVIQMAMNSRLKPDEFEKRLNSRAGLAITPDENTPSPQAPLPKGEGDK